MLCTWRPIISLWNKSLRRAFAMLRLGFSGCCCDFNATISRSSTRKVPSCSSRIRSAVNISGKCCLQRKWNLLSLLITLYAWVSVIPPWPLSRCLRGVQLKIHNVTKRLIQCKVPNEESFFSLIVSNNCYWSWARCQIFLCSERHANEAKGSIQCRIDPFASFACQTADKCDNSYWLLLAGCHEKISLH